MSTDKITLGKNVMQLDESPEYQPISCVRILAGNDSEGNQIVYEAGDQKSGRTIDVENRLIRDSDQGQLIANNILQAIQGYAYKPYRASGAILDPAAEIGDGVSIDEVYSVLADIETTFSPLMSANISAPEDGSIDHEYPYESSEDRAIIQEMAKMRTSFIVEQGKIASIIEEIGSVDEDGSIINRLTTVEQTASGIKAYTKEEIQQFAGDVATTKISNWAEANFTPEGISTQVTSYFDAKGAASEAFSDMRIYTDGAIAAVEGDYTSKIEQTAKSITQTVAAQESKWDTSELPAGVTISAWGYGKPTENGYPASAHAGEYYLNQSTGYYWYSDGTRWTSVRQLKLITTNLQTKINTTASGLETVVEETIPDLDASLSTKIQQTAQSITLSVSPTIEKDWWGNPILDEYGNYKYTGGTDFTIDGKGIEARTETVNLHVNALNIEGTIYANAVQAGATIQSPTIIGGAINGAAFHNAQGSASLELGANSGGYGDMTLYGYNPNSGNKWQVFRVYDNIGSVTFIGYGSTMGTFGSETKTFYAASGTTWDFRDARVLLPE